ncbi:glycine-rich cell wall structural protein 2 [Prunus yedoensis var. nudiflora]|uniref:Glycine-rich cell wall structural protein 2 n=1 Tax=Prunus yedoensis var. nudiflora TaxID=2094558 RepID=A0A314ZA79_PRUYE|nr:glycine-rich cell wall structural protein 2 [Prunus yedoensis var. nudiflora]
MPHGTLEVLLVSAKGLDNNDFLADMDPYVILTVRTQDKKSTIVSGQGSEPEWNGTFSFNVSDDVDELRLKIMDKDSFSSDDFVGETTVPLEAVFIEGNLPPTPYNVVNQEKEYHGEIKVGLTFTPEVDIVTHQSEAHCSFAPLFGRQPWFWRLRRWLGELWWKERIIT